MTPVLILAFVVLTCGFGASLTLNYRLLTRVNDLQTAHNAEMVVNLAAIHQRELAIGEERDELIKLQRSMLQKATTQADETLTRFAEETRKSVELHAKVMHDSMKVAWTPSGSDPFAMPPKSAPFPYPVAFYADESSKAAYDDTDPTDGFDDALATGRHDDALLATDSDLVIDGKFLGIPGLKPPPGVLDDRIMSMVGS